MSYHLRISCTVMHLSWGFLFTRVASIDPIIEREGAQKGAQDLAHRFHDFPFGNSARRFCSRTPRFFPHITQLSDSLPVQQDLHGRLQPYCCGGRRLEIVRACSSASRLSLRSTRMAGSRP